MVLASFAASVLLKKLVGCSEVISTTIEYDYGVDEPEPYAASSMGAYSGSG